MSRAQYTLLLIGYAFDALWKTKYKDNGKSNSDLGIYNDSYKYNDTGSSNIQAQSDVKGLSNLEKQKPLSKSKIKKQEDLIELSNRLYEFLPPACWYTEKNLAKKLGVSLRQIRKAKEYLLETGKIQIVLKQKDKRPNPCHYIYKIGSSDKNSTSLVKDCCINWELLSNYSPQKFNALSIEEKLDIYEEMGYRSFPCIFPSSIKMENHIAHVCEGKPVIPSEKHPAIVLSEYDFSDKATLKKMRRFFDGIDDCDVPEECREWNDRIDNRFNIAFLTNDFSVIDIDFRNGGAYSLELIQEIYGEIPCSFMSRSGNGLHFYTSSILNSTTNLLGFPGIDVRSKGGFINAPGSMHKSGTSYEWVALWMPEPLPDDLLSEIQQSQSQISQTGRKISKDEYIPKSPDEDYVIMEGTRGNTLFRIAIRERHKGKEYEEILVVIKRFNAVMCKPPVEQSRLEYTARSASENILSIPRLEGKD